MVKAMSAKDRGQKGRRHGKPKATAKRGAARTYGERRAQGLSDRKSIEQLAAMQGIRPTRLEDILGKGADLWKSEEEFEKFVEDIYARRRQDRELAKQ